MRKGWADLQKLLKSRKLGKTGTLGPIRIADDAATAGDSSLGRHPIQTLTCGAVEVQGLGWRGHLGNERSESCIKRALLPPYQAIRRENPATEVCCFFSIATNRDMGFISINMDTLDNNIEVGQTTRTVRHRESSKDADGDKAWRLDKTQMSTPVLSAFNRTVATSVCGFADV